MPANSPLQIVQSTYAAFGRGDMPALLGHLHADVTWRFVGDAAAPYTREAKGHDDVLRWFGQVAQADQIQGFEPREFLTGEDHVTVIGWERTVAQPGGKPFESEWVHVWKVRDGKVARFYGMLDTEKAGRARGQL